MLLNHNYLLYLKYPIFFTNVPGDKNNPPYLCSTKALNVSTRNFNGNSELASIRIGKSGIYLR